MREPADRRELERRMEIGHWVVANLDRVEQMITEAKEAAMAKPKRPKPGKPKPYGGQA